MKSWSTLSIPLNELIDEDIWGEKGFYLVIYRLLIPGKNICLKSVDGTSAFHFYSCEERFKSFPHSVFRDQIFSVIWSSMSWMWIWICSPPSSVHHQWAAFVLWLVRTNNKHYHTDRRSHILQPRSALIIWFFSGLIHAVAGSHCTGLVNRWKVAKKKQIIHFSTLLLVWVKKVFVSIKVVYRRSCAVCVWIFLTTLWDFHNKSLCSQFCRCLPVPRRSSELRVRSVCQSSMICARRAAVTRQQETFWLAEPTNFHLPPPVDWTDPNRSASSAICR